MTRLKSLVKKDIFAESDKEKLTLQFQIDELKNQVANLLTVINNKTELQQKSAGNSIRDEDNIRADDYVMIMSLIDHELNLSTHKNGTGKLFKFKKFGETKRVLYSDLTEILENHFSFAEAGYFYILDKRILRLYTLLESAYENVLDKDKIEKILACKNKDEALLFYSTANPKQQKIINEMIISKVRDNADSINLNIVDAISRVAKINLVEQANIAKEYMSDAKE